MSRRAVNPGPDNRLRFYAEAEHFLAQHLGGHAEAITDQTPTPAQAQPSPLPDREKD